MGERIQAVIDAEQGVLVLRFVGEISDADLSDLFARVVAMEGWSSSLHILADLRGIGGDTFSLNSVTRLAAHFRPRRADDSRTALLATDAHPFGLARQYASLSRRGDDQIRVFRDMEAALAWLGVEDPEGLLGA